MRNWGIIIISAIFCFCVVSPGQAAGDACNNPYFPLRVGNEIVYKNTGAGGGTTYSMKVVETRENWAKIRYIFNKQMEMTQEVFCENGTVRTNTYMNFESVGANVQMRSDTKGVEGDLMPPDMKVGDTWTTTYDMLTNYTTDAPVANLPQMTMTIMTINRVLGEERVKVPAGTYTAMKVESASSVKMATDSSYGAMAIPATASNVTFYNYWAKGVGLVKSTPVGADAGKWETVAIKASGGGIPFLDNPTVEAVAQGAAPAVAAAAVVNSAMAAQTTLSVDALRYLIFFVTQPVLLFKRRKRKAWGTVYNALSGLPEDLAVLHLTDAATGRVVGSEVTDRAGRFSFLVEPGRYKITARKANFVFPTGMLKAKKEDGQYLDLYHGEEIKAGEKGAVLTPNIPLDPEVKTLTDEKIVKKDKWRRAQSMIALAGPVMGGVSFIIKPSLMVTLLFILGILAYVFFRRFSTVPAPKNWGIVRPDKGEQGIEGAVLRVFAMPFDKMLDSRVTDKRGRYNFRVGNREFYMTVTKDGFEKVKTHEFDFSKTTEPEIIAEDIKLKESRS